MRSPLLLKPAQNVNFLQPLTFTIFTLLISFFILLHGYFVRREPQETAVGTIRWADFLLAYFALGNLPNEMEIGKHYRGPKTTLLPNERCTDETPTCHEVCKTRMRVGAAQSSVWDVKTGKSPKLPEASECTNINSKQMTECWETSNMRCWSLGNEVFDGKYEWTLLYQGEGMSLIPWIHLMDPSRNAEMFLFGWGTNHPIENYCDRMMQTAKLVRKLRIIKKEHTVILAGHNEGSAYAHCANLFLASATSPGHPPHLRRVISTGVWMASPTFVQDYRSANPMETMFNFIVGSDLPTIGPFSDIQSIIDAPPAHLTLPSFGFTCSSIYRQSDAHIDLDAITCLDPQPQLDITDSLKMSQLLPLSLKEDILKDMGSFRLYRNCFRKCVPIFQKNSVALDKFNVGQYRRRPPEIKSEFDLPEASPIPAERPQELAKIPISRFDVPSGMKISRPVQRERSRTPTPPDDFGTEDESRLPLKKRTEFKTRNREESSSNTKPASPPQIPPEHLTDIHIMGYLTEFSGALLHQQQGGSSSATNLQQSAGSQLQPMEVSDLGSTSSTHH